MPSVSYLQELDRIKDELQERFPGWQVWYVPRLHQSASWCARPWPLLNAQTPDHLAAEIGQARAEAAAEWPALRGAP